MRRVIETILILAVAAAPARAQKENVTERISVAFEAGFLTQYDDSDLWNQGYDVGVTGLWALSASTSLCARFGISHWSYASGPVVDDLTPYGAEVTAEQSSGQIESLALIPMIRYQREEVLGKLGAFVAGGVGIAYVKTFAYTELVYEAGTAGTQAATFEIDESDVVAEVMVGAGFSREVSSSSWIELIPTYRAIFADETAHVVAISLGFRVRV